MQMMHIVISDMIFSHCQDWATFKQLTVLASVQDNHKRTPAFHSRRSVICLFRCSNALVKLLFNGLLGFKAFDVTQRKLCYTLLWLKLKPDFFCVHRRVRFIESYCTVMSDIFDT